MKELMRRSNKLEKEDRLTAVNITGISLDD
jgi:hypothetical protein